MIELKMTTALMLYLIATISPLLLLWAYQHFLNRKRKIVIEKKDLLVCEFCHFCYLGQKGTPVSQCPQCLSYNKKSSN